jgi:hypothetical protein
MTYGDFAWNDLLRPQRRRDQVADRPRPRLVEGRPVPWMGAGEDAWVWQVQQATKGPLNRPNLTFILDQLHSRGRRALDDYLQPIVSSNRVPPVALWARLTEGERTGLRIADSSPPFPPRIERNFEIVSPAGNCEPAAVAEAVKEQRVIPGQTDIGVHLTLRRITRDDFDYGGNVRVIFDGLNELLGGSMSRPADTRICDLRLTVDRHNDLTTEVRVWQLDDRT